jgi:outer membrane protein TolC
MSLKHSDEDQLSSAKRDVAEARRIVERQRQLIEALRAGGRDTEDAERTLDAFLQSLATLEGHLRSLSKSIH